MADKTYTQTEVDAMLEQKEKDVREKAINVLVAKNADLKQDLALNGQDENFNLGRWETMMKMSTEMVKSGAFPESDNMYTIAVKMQAGYEMGMKPMEAIKSFYVVKGVLSIFGSAVQRRLREHGWIIQYTDEPNKCTAIISKGNESYTDTLTFDDAEKSKWTTTFNGSLKPGWYEGANRKLKLRYGVASLLIKTYVPEVLGSAVDIKEIAEDVIPTIEAAKVAIAPVVGGDEPATAQQIETLKNAGADRTRTAWTKQQAADEIDRLMKEKMEAKKVKEAKKPKEPVAEATAPEAPKTQE